MKKFFVALLLMLSIGLAVTASAADITPVQPSGDGTSSSPYLIGTKEELYWFADAVNVSGDKDACAKLTADITVNETVFENGSVVSNTAALIRWTPISAYAGTFDGNGYTISGLYDLKTVTNSVNEGFFKYLDGGTVQNLTIADSYFKSQSSYLGAIAGGNYGGSITNCHVRNCSIVGATCTGGIVGSNEGGTISKCSSNTLLTSTSDKVGGIAGSNSGRIEYCYNTGHIAGEEQVGGIVGFYESEQAANSDITPVVTQCYNVGNVIGGKDTIKIGGIVGNAKDYAGTVKNVTFCYYLDTCPLVGVPNSKGTALTASQMTSDTAWKTSFSGFSTSVWNKKANEGTKAYLPQLSNGYSPCLERKIYTVTIASGISNGSVTVDVTSAGAGDTVTLSSTPADGYLLDKYTVTDANGVAVTVTNGVFTMPASNVTVSAAFKIDDSHSHAPCGEDSCTAHDNHTVHAYRAVDDIGDIRLVAGDNYYYLKNDISSSSGLSVDTDQTLYLCLNGNDIVVTSGSAAIDVVGNGKLILCDCVGSSADNWGKIKHAGGGRGMLVGYYTSNGTQSVVEMYGGNITENSRVHDSDKDGSGVYLNDGAQFIMYNGGITKNTSLSVGGGVYMTKGATFVMHNGVISENTALDGGGLYRESINFGETGITIYDGVISGNTAKNRGGGMYLHRSQLDFGVYDVVINGGSIKENTAVEMGAGLFVDYAQVKMNGGTISNNICANGSGGGVATHGNGWLHMSGGSISGNTASTGAGVYVDGAIRVDGAATVTGNTTGSGTANNVYLPSKTYLYVTSKLSGKLGVYTADKPTAEIPVRYLNGWQAYKITTEDLEHTSSDRSDDYFDIKNIDQYNYGVFGYVQYKVAVSTVVNGKVTASSSSAAEGKSIGLTIEPDTGYELDTVKVYDADGEAVEVSADYKFTMPASDVTVEATFQPMQYTIQFMNMDGTVLQSTEVAYGEMPVYTGETPTVAADAQYTYTFTGWSPDVVKVTGAATYTATYSNSINTYTVTWVDEDGTTVLETDEDVPYGTMPSYDGETPTKAADAQYTYTFTGWSPEIVAVTGEATYTATYSNSTNTYTVTWVDEDGTTVLEKDEGVPYGTMPSYNGKTPAKAADAQYTYTFSGWSPSVVNVSGNATYTATYSDSTNTYTVTWVDEDGTTVLEKDEGVPYGTMPSYDGAKPTKTATAQYTYTFDKWSPEISAVSGTVTYKATYTATVNKYTIQFMNVDGTVLQSTEVAYGEIPAYAGETPKKAADAQYTYTFAGWTPDVVKVTGAATYKATFSNSTNSYTVTWQNEAGELIDAESVEYGGSVTKSPAVPDKLGHTGKWNHDGKNIVQNTIIKPEYTANQYTLTFNTDGGSVIAPITQKYGSAVTAPAAPVKEGWIFQGWDKVLPATMPAESMAFTAKWAPRTTLASFSLSATEIWLHSTQTHQLEVTGLNPSDALCEFTWTSSDTSVLSVDSTGLLTAAAPGTAVLTVKEKWSGLSKTCTVHVASPVTAITFAETALQMAPGDTRTLTATVTCSDQTVTNKLVTFSSSDEKVATVDQNGIVTAVSEGSVTITATAANGVSASCTIKVLLLGDANGDGKVDVADVLIILQYSAGWDVTVNTVKADVTGDGTIGLSDALKILQDCMGGDIALAMRTLQRMLADLNASALEITEQPADQHVKAGETAAFTVTATGDVLKYQWYIDRNDGNGWQKLNNAVEAIYVTSTVDADNDGYQYRCVIADAHGNEATTDTAELHVVLDLPNTGDASTPALWLAMCLLSAIGLMILKKKLAIR